MCDWVGWNKDLMGIILIRLAWFGLVLEDYFKKCNILTRLPKSYYLLVTGQALSAYKSLYKIFWLYSILYNFSELSRII